MLLGSVVSEQRKSTKSGTGEMEEESVTGELEEEFGTGELEKAGTGVELAEAGTHEQTSQVLLLCCVDLYWFHVLVPWLLFL